MTMDLSRPLSTITPTLDGDVLQVLARGTAPLSGRAVHRLVRARASEDGVRRALSRLVDQGIVTRQQAGRAWMYRLNRKHLAADAVAQLAAMRATLVDRMRSAMLEWEVQPALALLFGSTSRADATAMSDIDMLVVRPSPLDADDPRWSRDLLGFAEDVWSWTGNELGLIEFSEDELEGDLPGVATSALRDGIELIGDLNTWRRRLGWRAGVQT